MERHQLSWQRGAKRLEWTVEADGSIRVYPIDQSPSQAFCAMGQRGGPCQCLLADRDADRGSGR